MDDIISNEVLNSNAVEANTIHFNPLDVTGKQSADAMREFILGKQRDQKEIPLMVNDSEVSSTDKLARLINSRLDPATKQMLVQHVLDEHSAEAANQRSMENTANYYPNLVKGLKAAGLNPFLALQSLGGSAPSAPKASVNGGDYVSLANSRRQNLTNMSTSIGAIIAIIAAAMIKAAA